LPKLWHVIGVGTRLSGKSNKSPRAHYRYYTHTRGHRTHVYFWTGAFFFFFYMFRNLFLFTGRGNATVAAAFVCHLNSRTTVYTRASINNGHRRDVTLVHLSHPAHSTQQEPQVEFSVNYLFIRTLHDICIVCKYIISYINRGA